MTGSMAELSFSGTRWQATNGATMIRWAPELDRSRITSSSKDNSTVLDARKAANQTSRCWYSARQCNCPTARTDMHRTRTGLHLTQTSPIRYWRNGYVELCPLPGQGGRAFLQPEPRTRAALRISTPEAYTGEACRMNSGYWL